MFLMGCFVFGAHNVPRDPVLGAIGININVPPKTREEMLAEIHAASNHAAACGNRFSIQPMTETEFTERRNQLIVDITALDDKMSLLKAEMKALDSSKTGYRDEVDNLDIQLKQYERWIRELNSHATTISTQAATCFFLERGKKPFQIDFVTKRMQVFADFLSQMETRTESIPDDDLVEEGSVSSQRQTDDATPAREFVQALDPVRTLLNTVNQIIFAEHCDSVLAEKKRELESLKREKNQLEASLRDLIKEVESLLVDRADLHEKILKYVWAERQLTSIYNRLLIACSKRSSFELQWKTESAQIMRELDVFLAPKTDIFAELARFNELVPPLAGDAQRAITERSLVSWHSRGSVVPSVSRTAN
ncbi:MAG: hypothetical protein AAB323_01470 [Pseudomonadota bacterium]